MNATLTTCYGYPATPALETIAAWTAEANHAARALLMLVGAPLIGLAFVVLFPLAGLALLAWMAAKALARRRAAIGGVVKRIGLFAAAPFVGLVYIAAFPLVGLGALAYYGVRAARK
jgi:hypothetical protein